MCVSTLIAALECACVWTSSLSAFAPSFTLHLSHKASVPFSSAGVLSGDSSSGTHVPSFWHWPWVIEMQTENTLNQMGSKSGKYLARTFFHWWSRPVYGRWNKVRADGHLEYRAFIWTVLKSNKATTTTCRNRKGCERAKADLLSLKIEQEEGQCKSQEKIICLKTTVWNEWRLNW